MQNYGQALRLKRRRALLTQAELGKLIGKSGATISRMERGATAITIELWYKLNEVITQHDNHNER